MDFAIAGVHCICYLNQTNTNNLETNESIQKIKWVHEETNLNLFTNASMTNDMEVLILKIKFCPRLLATRGAIGQCPIIYTSLTFPIF